MLKLVCGIVLVLAPIFAVESSFMRSREDEEGCYDKVGWCGTVKMKGFCDPRSLYYAHFSTRCRATCGICKATPIAAPVAQPVQVNPPACLAAHNEKRRLHGSLDLTWDANLAQGAQAWSVRQAQTFKRPIDIDHSAGPYGENMAYFQAFSHGATNWKNIVNDWYSEINNYNWLKPGTSTVPGKFVGHFTQVVWKRTTKVGCGMASIKKGSLVHYVVFCRYTPSGNVLGGYADNVKPKSIG